MNNPYTPDKICKESIMTWVLLSLCKRKKNWPEMKCQELTSQMIVGPWISFCALGTQLPEVSLVVEVQKDTFQLGWHNGLSGRKDISQIVGIVDLVDDKLTNEHLLLTKVKCLPPPLFTLFFWGTHLNHPHFFPTPQTKEKGGKAQTPSHMVQCKCWFYQQQDVC